MESTSDSQPSAKSTTQEASPTSITEPVAAHIRASQETLPETLPDNSEDEREATELHTVQSQGHTQQRRVSRIISPGKPKLHWYDPFKKLWRHHIRIAVPHVDCRDHLANERTYLGYMRTSVALSMLGITVAQLYRLQHVAQPNSIFGYFLLSKPIAGIFQCSAMLMNLVGAIRFFRQQQRMSVGKVLAGGWEIYFVCGFVFILLLAMFGVHLGIDVYKER